VRILTVMGAVYNGLEKVRLQRHQHPREQQLHRRLQCFRQQNGKLPQQHIWRDHQPDARGLETCFSAATWAAITLPPDQDGDRAKNTPECTRARHGRCLGGLECCGLLLILYRRSEQYQSMNSRIAWSYERCELREVRLLRTADFDCSRSGSFRTVLGLSLRSLLAMSAV